MSQENVEIVRRSIEFFRAAMERGDPGDFDPAIIAEEFEWVLSGRGFEGKRVWAGSEFADFVRLWTAEFDDWSFQVERLIDAGNDRVVALARQSGTGKESGVSVEWDNAVVYELRDGRIVRATNYFSHADALEAAGLEE